MYWKLALAQHPMYLLIKEDTECAERTPPWGAPDIERYIDRLRQNIATLRKYPQVKIGYEWSGLELEQLKQDAPDVFSDMLDLVKDGQTTFYNGTYSQPHLQTLSAEANYRQFEWGAQVYRTLCDHQVQVYAHQESSVNEQTPQILKAFGIRYVVMPHFSSTLVMIDGGELVYHSRFGTMFMHGEEFAGWRGLDGTVLDLYLNEPKHGIPVQDWLDFQEIIGLTHVPPIVVENPDLIDIDDDWVRRRSKAEFALLDGALDERHKAFPPRFQVRFYTNWSYIEGIRAEELSRNNWKAEGSALRAEALNSLALVLVDREPESTDAIWKKILTTQHHDVYCFCAPELREKSVSWLHEAEAEAAQMAEAAAQAIASQVDTTELSGQPLVVFNTVPHLQTAVVSAVVDVPNPVVVCDGVSLPSEAIPLPSGMWQVRFIPCLSGFGYSAMQVQSNGEKTSKEICGGDFIFENDSYRAVVQPDGTFASLVLQPSGEELLEGGEHLGNFLTARDSTGLGSRHEGTFDLSAGKRLEPCGLGPELVWQTSGPAQIDRSPLGATFTVFGEIGPRVKASLQAHFYHTLARIDLDWTFRFETASIGHFFNDETKLRAQWPLSYQGQIHHDIAFGVVESRDERPFLPASWVDISDGRKGLAYFHQGTLKHWVTKNILVNLFAWGEDTDAIGNRLDMLRWPRCFDQRLHGTHTIHSALYPHPGDWRKADVISAARSFGMPPAAYLTGRHSGKLPARKTVFQLQGAELAATAVKPETMQTVCRFYSVSQKSEPVTFTTDGLSQVKLTGLDGAVIEKIDPFQIGMIYLR